MRHLLWLALLILIFSGAVTILRAQPNTLYFMKGLPQTKEMNPARSGVKNGFYFSMPLISSVDVSVNSDNLNFNDLVHLGTGAKKDSMVWDFPKFIGSMSKNNFVFGTATLTLLDFGWKMKEKSYSFSLCEHVIIEPFLSKEMAELIYCGNYRFKGSTFVSGDFGLSAMHYRQFAFNYSKDLNKKITLGGTGKILLGMSGIKTKKLGLTAGMPASGDLINLSANGEVKMAAPLRVSQNPSDNYDFNTTSDFSVGKYLLDLSNPGIALDMGMTAKITKRLELSASLIDLGAIRWSGNVSAFSGQGSFPYQGINLNDPSQKPPTAKLINPLIQNLKDSILKAFPVEVNPNGFFMMLPVKLYLGAEYRLNSKFSLGALARIRMFNQTFYSSGTASLNLSVRKNLSLTAAYSYFESTYNNLGVGALLRVKFFQVYAATDNLASNFYPLKAKYLNLKFGVNLMFEEIDRITKRNHQYIPTSKAIRRKM